jgi:hypothetical protein
VATGISPCLSSFFNMFQYAHNGMDLSRLFLFERLYALLSKDHYEVFATFVASSPTSIHSTSVSNVVCRTSLMALLMNSMLYNPRLRHLPENIGLKCSDQSQIFLSVWFCVKIHKTKHLLQYGAAGTKILQQLHIQDSISQ